MKTSAIFRSVDLQRLGIIDVTDCCGENPMRIEFKNHRIVVTPDQTNFCKQPYVVVVDEFCVKWNDDVQRYQLYIHERFTSSYYTFNIIIDELNKWDDIITLGKVYKCI